MLLPKSTVRSADPNPSRRSDRAPGWNAVARPCVAHRQPTPVPANTTKVGVNAALAHSSQRPHHESQPPHLAHGSPQASRKPVYGLCHRPARRAVTSSWPAEPSFSSSLFIGAKQQESGDHSQTCLLGAEGKILLEQNRLLPCNHVSRLEIMNQCRNLWHLIGTRHAESVSGSWIGPSCSHFSRVQAGWLVLTSHSGCANPLVIVSFHTFTSII